MLNFGHKISIISLVVMLGVLGGLSSAYAMSLDWDQEMYMIEHGGILTLVLDSDPDPNNPNHVEIATISLSDGSNEILVDLKRDTETQFSSFFINFTVSGTGTNQLSIPGDPNGLPVGILADVDVTGLNPATSEVSQTNAEKLRDVDNKYRGKTPFIVNAGVCEDPDYSLGGDTDGDGLCDKWEDTTQMAIPGLKVFLDDPEEFYFLECDPTEDYTSNPLGDLVCPDPDKADIYYEIDWMVGHTPSEIALIDNVENFRWSWYWTDAGVKGINLHIQRDEGILPHVDAIPNPGGGQLSGTDALKKFWYGTFIERGNIEIPDKWTGPIRNLKNYAFHYAIFAHDRYGDIGSSGYSEFPGNDVMITLGSWDGAVGSPDTQAGTLLHEIGHNLGRDHGGEDEVNCKPNYISVMSFSRQTSDLVDRDVRLAKAAINNLDETFTGPQALGIINQYNPFTTVYSNSSGGIFYTDDSNTPHDFGTPTELNFFSIVDCPQDGLEVLYSFSDLENPEFVSWGHANWKDGVSIPGASNTSGEYDVGSTITRVQLESVPPVGDIEGPDEACINFNSKDGKKANPAISRICIGDELTFDDSIEMRMSRINSLQDEVMGIQDNYFIDKTKVSFYKNEYMIQLDNIRGKINQKDMISTIEETKIFQSWFDGEGEKEYVQNKESRDNIHALTASVIEAQLTVVPEFGTIAIVVLSISLITVIAFTGRSKLSLARISQ